MADPREFILIGSFTDNITPTLNAINTSIGKLKANISDLSSVTKPLKDDFKDLTQLSKDFKTSLGSQAADIREMTTALRAFRGEMGRVNRSYRAGGNRIMRQAAGARTPNASPTPRMPSIPQPPRGGGGGGPRGGGGGYAAAVGGGIVGNQLAGVMTSAIVQGFQMGTRIMEAPFKYFQNALGERVKDEMSDLKAAGGLYSIAKRQKDPFVKTMDEAIQYTQSNNLALAKLAAALPGSTQDYIEVSKRISDTVTRVVAKDVPAAIKEANMIRSTEEGRKFYGGNITSTGQQGTQQAITTLLGELTKKTVLAGFGGRAGAGGAMGPYGLPGLSERLISQDQVSVSQFQRYSAIFSDPQILDALQRNIGKINATQKDSIERYKVLNALYDDILPPELIEKFRRSVSGINEAIASATTNPEVGLFGIGRKITGLGRRMNDFGQYVDETGKVVTEVNDAAKANLSLYDLLRDIYAQTAQVLVPIIEVLPELWDPLKKIGESLSDARHYTGQFLKSFISYKEGLKNYAQTLGEAGKMKIMGSLDIRSSLLSIANLFKQLNVIGSGEFADLSKQLVSPDANIGKILQSLVDKLFNSKVAEEVGAFLGKLIGTVLRQVGDATNYIANTIEGGGFGGGFAKAFKDAGGFSGIQDIFVNIVKLFIKAIGTAIKEMPLLSGLAVAFAVIPGIIGAAITASVERAMGSLQRDTRGMVGRRGGRGGFGAMFGPTDAMQSARRRPRAALGRGVRSAQNLGGQAAYAANLGYSFAGRPGAKTLGKVGEGIGAAGRFAANAGKFVPGAAVAGGAIDMGVALASGESFGKAAAGAIGTVLGGTAGSIFGPVGTTIGMVAGNYLATNLFSKLDPTAVKNELAAQKQLEAAAGQQKAAGIRDVTGTKTPFAFDSQKLVEAFKLASGTQTITPQQQALVDALRARNLDAKAFETASKTLADMKTSLAQVYAPGSDKFKNAIAPYERVLGAAAVKLKTSQGVFDAGFAKLPATIATSVVTKISTMSTEQISAALATKINQIQLQANLNANSQLIQQAGGTPGITPARQPIPANSYSGLANPTTRYKGGLGDAIATEMKHKPLGSRLVIANSSETVIPAAGGYGMKDFMGYMQSGFDRMATMIPRAVQMGSMGYGSYGSTGGGTIENIYVTVNAGSTSDPDTLASLVAIKIGEAVADARAASIFV